MGSKPYFINAYISYIKTDDNTVYPSCIKCKKKVIKDTQYYWCEACDETVDQPNFNYNLTTRLEDCTGNIYARFFGSQALQIMHPTTPKQFNIAWVGAQNDEKEFKELLHSKMYIPHNLMISAKQNSFGQNSRIDYYV